MRQAPGDDARDQVQQVAAEHAGNVEDEAESGVSPGSKGTPRPDRLSRPQGIALPLTGEPRAAVADIEAADARGDF